MPDELDSLIISASVLDDFSDTLDELLAELSRIDAEEEDTFPIDADMRIAEFMVKAQQVKKELREIDRMDPEADVDVDQDPLQESVEGIATRGAARAGMLGFMGEGPAAHEFDETTIMPENLDIDIDRRASQAIGGTLSQTVEEAMDMPDLFEGRRDRSPARKLFQEFVDLRLFMSGFMNTMAALIPLMGVFVGALPAAIAGIGALAAAAIAAAGALAAPIGLGIGGMIFAGGQLDVAELQDQIRQTLDTFLQAFTPVMEALQPMVEGLFNQFRFLIRDLSRRSNILLQLTDDIAGGFQFLSETIGPALEDFILFGQAALPTMQLLIGGLASFDWFKIFSSVLRQTLPLMDILATQIVAIVPAIFEISMGFFLVADAILALLGGLSRLITAVPFLGEGFGVLIGLLFTAISATALYSVAVNSALTRLVGLAIQGLGTAIPAIHTYIASMFGATAATWTMIAAASVLLGVLTFGLGPALGGVLGQFVGLGDGVSYATSELARFERQATRTSAPPMAGGPPGAGRAQPGYGPNRGGGMTVVAPDKETGNAVANTMRWQNGWSPSSPTSDINNRKHSE